MPIFYSEGRGDELHGVTLQRMAIFMVIATRIPDCTTLHTGCIYCSGVECLSITCVPSVSLLLCCLYFTPEITCGF